MYRAEHPNPQFERDSFESLNGTWEFEIGKGERRTDCPLSGRIEVPFCPQSALSGVGVTDFIDGCVYSRIINVTEEDLTGRLVLHFGAVDYKAQVYVNGQYITSHVGGYTAFEADITTAVHAGENRITVVVQDDMREEFPSWGVEYWSMKNGLPYPSKLALPEADESLLEDRTETVMPGGAVRFDSLDKNTYLRLDGQAVEDGVYVDGTKIVVPAKDGAVYTAYICYIYEPDKKAEITIQVQDEPEKEEVVSESGLWGVRR